MHIRCHRHAGRPATQIQYRRYGGSSACICRLPAECALQVAATRSCSITTSGAGCSALYTTYLPYAVPSLMQQSTEFSLCKEVRIKMCLYQLATAQGRRFASTGKRYRP